MWVQGNWCHSPLKFHDFSTVTSGVSRLCPKNLVLWKVECSSEMAPYHSSVEVICWARDISILSRRQGGGSLRGFECSNFSLVKIVFFLEMSEAIDQLTWKDLEVQLVSKQLVHFFKYLGEIIFSNKQNNSLKFADSTHQVWKPRWMLLMINIFRSLDAKTLILKTFWRRHFERCMIYMYIYIYFFFWLTWIWFPFGFGVFFWFSHIFVDEKNIYIYISILYMLNRCWNNLRASTIWETYL